MDAGVVRIKIHGPSATIILNRPEKRNALSRLVLDELQQALTDLHLEKKVRAVILTGAGDVFCAGMDLFEMMETAKSDDPHPQWYQDAEQLREILETMLRYPKPIIAAVNGPALAGGVGLVAACDYVLAAPEAKFGLPEPKRGIMAGIISPLLAFRVGGGQAARLLVTTQTIDATEAHRIGLVHEIVKSNDHCWAAAHAWAEEIAKSAPTAIQLTKRMIYENIGEHLFTLLSAGAAMSATARTTESAAEGVKAFFEKREPKWS
jgi:methylglutaconyl-CoA hydratase